jgi:hypothetical protein
MALIPTLWGPWVTYPEYPICIQFMILWLVCRESTIRVDTRITSSITVPNNILTIGHMTKFDIATQGKFTAKQRIPSSVDDPRHANYPIGNWLGDVPSLHRRHRTSHHCPHNLLHYLTKLIARDKAVSTFWNCTRKPSKRKVVSCSLAVARWKALVLFILTSQILVLI